jgi:hypothetical protein
VTFTLLYAFVSESNLIEGIGRAPTMEELAAHELFLELPSIGVSDLETFVRVVAGAQLRARPGDNVRVGGHVPPPGGPAVADALRELLAWGAGTPHGVHVAYETLHPFMDGNGRSGRVLWAWQMRAAGLDPFVRPFLQTFYYQTLSESR